MQKETGSGRLVVVLICLCICGSVIAWSTYGPNSNAAIERDLEQHKKDLADSNKPTELSAQMRDQSWTIKYWMGVDSKQSDCEEANEMMDKHTYARQTTKRGVVQHTYYLSDYVSSCGNTVTRTLSYVGPQVKKWCQYRTTDPRFDTLCAEWQQNKDAYVALLQAATQPTVDRYASYPYKGVLAPS